MANDATQLWNITEGVIVAPGSTTDDVAARLRERAVVARLEWYPATAHLLSITLLLDAEGRVAVTPPSRGGVVPGMGARRGPGPRVRGGRDHRPGVLQRPARGR